MPYPLGPFKKLPVDPNISLWEKKYPPVSEPWDSEIPIGRPYQTKFSRSQWKGLNSGFLLPPFSFLFPALQYYLLLSDAGARQESAAYLSQLPILRLVKSALHHIDVFFYCGGVYLWLGYW